MRAILTHTPTLYTPTQAAAVAASLQADSEDGWTYTVRHDPTGRGYSLIDVYDEDGECLGQM